MDKIDVWEIAKKIEESHVHQIREEIEELVDSKDRKIGMQEIIEVIGISNRSSREFTIKLLQDTIDQLQQDK